MQQVKNDLDLGGDDGKMFISDFADDFSESGLEEHMNRDAQRLSMLIDYDTQLLDEGKSEIIESARAYNAKGKAVCPEDMHLAIVPLVTPVEQQSMTSGLSPEGEIADGKKSKEGHGLINVPQAGKSVRKRSRKQKIPVVVLRQSTRIKHDGIPITLKA
ncbi:hypothetical protein ABZP36_011324 [Zizania latifolia]